MATLPESVQVTTSSRGTTWRLPARTEKRSVIEFIIHLVVAVAWCSFVGFFASKFLGDFWHGFGGGLRSPIALFLLLFFIPFIITPIKMIFRLLTYFQPSCVEITLGDDRLYAVERKGFLSSRSKRKRSGIRLIRVAELDDELVRNITKKNPDVADGIKKMIKDESRGHAIYITTEKSNKDWVIAAGYPRDLLASVAYALAEACGQDASAVLNVESKNDAPAVEITPTAEEITTQQITQQTTGVILPKPASSSAIVVDSGKDVTIVLPPNGFRGGSRAMLIFSFIWLAFVNVMLTVIVLASLKIIGGEVHGNPLGGVFVLGLFELIGFAMLLGAIHFARQKTVMIAGKQQLFITQVSPIKKTEKQWDSEMIEKITWGPSGTEVNGKPLMQLQVIATGGKKHGLLSGRNDDELAWLAQELSRAIR